MVVGISLWGTSWAQQPHDSHVGGVGAGCGDGGDICRGAGGDDAGGSSA